MAQPFIRPYNPTTDFASCIEIFRATADASLHSEPLCTLGSYIWCRPYLFLSPRTCFLLDDGAGRAVGYCIGVADSASFCDGWRERYGRAVEREVPHGEDKRTQGLLKALLEKPEELVFGGYGTTLAPWPGHLHINILPSYQRQGYGKLLLSRLLEALKAEGCRGVFLGMVAGNEGAGRFYEALGFRRVGTVLDGGLSGEVGRTRGEDGGGGGTIYYVMDL